MSVTFRQMQVFCAIAQEKNFSRAGDVVGMSQPAVSRALLELEEQLSVRLFDRTTREVRLTEAGEILAQRLPRWMDELQNTFLELQSWAGSRRGKVRVASSPTISASLMPTCLAQCAEQEPGLDVLLLDRIQQDVVKSVLAAEVDFGIIVEMRDDHLRDIHCETIMEDPFVVVLPQAHALARKKRSTPVVWNELDEQKLILLDHASGSRRLIDDALQQHQVRHTVRQQVGHATTGFEMVKAGLGLSVMPGLAIPETGLSGLAVRRLTPPVRRRIMLVHRKNRTPAPLAQYLWTLVKECSLVVAKRRERLWK